MPEPSAALTYSSYLALDEVLAAQRPKTDEHDELLFIVIHQVYELWFKQLLHELGPPAAPAGGGGGAARARDTLRRVLTILKTVVAQIDVLETMTPSQFATFRARLDAASGFQSAQFRELEAVLGRRDDGALDAYEPGSPSAQRIAAAMRRPLAVRLVPALPRERRARRPAAALERDVTPAGRAVGGRPARGARGLPPRRRGRRRSPSAWSTSTRACRSGATAT